MDGLTPMPQAKSKFVTMSFFDAIKKIHEGKQVQRISWGNNDYCLVKDGWLTIFTTKDSQFHTWSINDGDMEGEDWVLLIDAN